MARQREAVVGDIRETWKGFLKRHYKRELADIQREFPHNRSLYLDYRKIERFGKDGLILADSLLENPGKVIEDVKDTLVALGPFKESDKDLLNIRFVNLPTQAIIRIYSVSGILVDVLEHNDPGLGGEADWDVRNRNQQTVASGVYFYHVETPSGAEKIGRFTVVNYGNLAPLGLLQ